MAENDYVVETHGLTKRFGSADGGLAESISRSRAASRSATSARTAPARRR